MSECPECGMRDDDWFLCRRDKCPIGVKSGVAAEIARLQEQVETLTKERDEAREAKAEREYECSCFAAENIRLTVEIDSLISSRMRMKARYRNAAIKAARCAEAAEARIAGLEAAGNAVLASWDERMPDGPETFKTSDELGFSYWSPSASMVSSEAMSKLRAALEGDDNA